MQRYSDQPPLLPCRETGTDTELFLVEGESAAGAVGAVRDARFQAVLPLRGKPLNALRATKARVAAHPFFAALCTTLGVSLGSPSTGSSPHGRLVLLMDPDADGIHCGALVVAFLHRWMTPLLEEERVVVIRPPWGEIVSADGVRVDLAWSEDELRRRAAASAPAATARRFRGLAGLDSRLLARWCVAPATRREERVTVANAAAIASVLGD